MRANDSWIEIHSVRIYIYISVIFIFVEIGKNGGEKEEEESGTKEETFIRVSSRFHNG